MTSHSLRTLAPIKSSFFTDKDQTLKFSIRTQGGFQRRQNGATDVQQATEEIFKRMFSP